MTPIPALVADDEPLHRRVHPLFVKPDGSVSSQAFRDPDLSVDRGQYRPTQETMRGCETHGLVALIAAAARHLHQEVVAAPELFNPAHALVKGTKSKNTAKALARATTWVIAVGGQSETAG